MQPTWMSPERKSSARAGAGGAVGEPRRDRPARSSAICSARANLCDHWSRASSRLEILKCAEVELASRSGATGARWRPRSGSRPFSPTAESRCLCVASLEGLDVVGAIAHQPHASGRPGPCEAIGVGVMIASASTSGSAGREHVVDEVHWSAPRIGRCRRGRRRVRRGCRAPARPAGRSGTRTAWPVARPARAGPSTYVGRARSPAHGAAGCGSPGSASRRRGSPRSRRCALRRSPAPRGWRASQRRAVGGDRAPAVADVVIVPHHVARARWRAPRAPPRATS